LHPTGQEITLVAVGDAYTSWEGYKDPETGETRIGISYEQLCDDVKEGSRILIGDGAILIQVCAVCICSGGSHMLLKCLVRVSAIIRLTPFRLGINWRYALDESDCL
jgi:pyruvate kinase